MRLAAVGCGCLGPILLDGWVGYGAGLALAYGAWRWHHRNAARRAGEPTDEVAHATDSTLTTDQKALAAAQLPLTAELLAACLAAGAGPGEAAEAVGGSLDGPVGQRLARASAELRLGGDPSVVWGHVGALPGAVRLARSLERAMVTGAPAVEPVTRLALDCRAERGRTATARARRAGVLATAPLGLCFLPAFLLVGVAPVVIGLADGLLTT
ncbi:type II secretion system F family protein [Streptomyces sp. NPDC057702]|uniref:type II secretion system F family protein n=1 Tax=unclassified Streptomyces TaxID=2593676 RepID=UPI0036C9FE47